MTQSRKKRRLREGAEAVAAVADDLKLPEVAEALAGEALAVEREAAAAAQEAAEQEALIAATQESEGTLDNAFQLKRTVESLLFASDRPLTVADFRQYLGANIVRADLQASLDALVSDYQDRGIVLYDVAGGYQFRTHASSSQWIQKLIAGRPVRLSRAQLDTLAIIAYRQPITRPEVDEIRGVDSGSTLKVLLDRSLIRIMGKKEEVGRPLLYGTTKEFLEFFNLAELRDLPTLREFHELNDEGMAEVDKLGADIEGVDVGEVAAQVASEREAAEQAALEAAEALAAEKQALKEAAKAEKLAAAAEAARAEADEASDEDMFASSDEEPEENKDSADDEMLASADEEPEESDDLDEEDMLASSDEELENNDASADEEMLASADEEPSESDDSDEEEMLASADLDQENNEEDEMMHGRDETELGDEGEGDSTRVDTEPEVTQDPDTIMETQPGAGFADAAVADETRVDREPVEEDTSDVGEALSDFEDGGEPTMMDGVSEAISSSESDFDPELTAPDSFVPERGSDGHTVSSSDSSE